MGLPHTGQKRLPWSLAHSWLVPAHLEASAIALGFGPGRRSIALNASTSKLSQTGAIASRLTGCGPAIERPHATLWFRAAIKKFADEWERKPGRPRRDIAV
jgi:hypothetical protein